MATVDLPLPLGDSFAAVESSARPAALPSELVPVLADFRKRLEAVFGARLKGVRLYGSWARGEQGPESDVDVAVLVEGLSREDLQQVVCLGVDTWHATDCQLSVQPHDAAHFARMVEREHPYYAAVAREGLPA